jgi:hypothetical protein
MLREWDKKYPGRVESMFSALQNVVPSHLADGTHYDFKGLKATGVASEDGDKAFDAEDFPPAAHCRPASRPPLSRAVQAAHQRSPMPNLSIASILPMRCAAGPAGRLFITGCASTFHAGQRGAQLLQLARRAGQPGLPV